MTTQEPAAGIGRFALKHWLVIFIGIGVVYALYALNEAQEPERIERRYLSAKANIAQARADYFRAQMECRAQAIEFDREMAKMCVDDLPLHSEMATATIEASQATMEKMEARYCPGPNWCPRSPARNPG